MGDVGGIVDNTLGTNMFGGNANEQALQAQTAGTQQAISAMQPWQTAGTDALGMLAGNSFMDGFKGSPAMQFQLDQAKNATNANMSARGLGNSGAALKALQDRAQGIASQDYQQQYQNEMGRLGMLSGYGNQAANKVADLHTGLGNAGAGAAMGRANQTSSALNMGMKGLALMSDERTKTNISEISSEDLAEMKKHLKAYAFNYKNDEHGSGDWIGVMAQDLEKSKLGKTLVVENEHGLKTIDQKKVLSMFLATMAEAA